MIAASDSSFGTSWGAGCAVAVLAMTVLGANACGPSANPGGEPTSAHAAELRSARSFVDSREFRRNTLETSLVDRDNGYARLRLSNYATAGAEWERLEVWNPPVRPVTTDDIGAFGDDPYAQSSGDFQRVLPPTDSPAADEPFSHDRLMKLGRRAFFNYPLQVDMVTGGTTDARESLRRYGLWIGRAHGDVTERDNNDKKARVGGLVRVRLPGGREGFAKTCATCHASPNGAAVPSDTSGPPSSPSIVPGRANAAFDRGALLTGRHPGGQNGAAAAQWGPGRIDVTPDGRHNPVAIPDLRAVRHQTHLHWTGTLRNSLAALAVRTDTLLITSLNQQFRPPRRVSAALTYYIWHLGDEAGESGPNDGSRSGSAEGAKLFQTTCSPCHHADGTTAPPVAAERAGTDPAVARSPTRGTGRYRVPSLRGVADRSRYLHTGDVRSLVKLFDPARLEDVPGHRWGTDLSNTKRQALIAYLETL